MAHEEKIRFDNMEYVTSEKAKKALRDGFDEAKKTLEDDGNVELLLQKLEDKIGSIPLSEGALRHIPFLASLVNMHVRKEYNDAPIGSIIAAVSALIYVVASVDGIPDFIPGLGYTDDSAVVAACLSLIKTDLETYKSWRVKNGYETGDSFDFSDQSKNAEFYTCIVNTAKQKED